MQEYKVPYTLFKTMEWIIRDYYRQLDEIDSILESSPHPDGMPRGSNISDPTSTKAIVLASMSTTTKAVEQACIEMISRYSKFTEFQPIEAFNDYGYFSYITTDERKAAAPAYITWKRYRVKFAYFVAKNLHYL